MTTRRGNVRRHQEWTANVSVYASAVPRRRIEPHRRDRPVPLGADPGRPVRLRGGLAGAQGAMEQTFGSSCHGAGRLLSRTAAKKEVEGGALKQELAARGIRVRAGSMKGLAEEAPLAYKPIEEVIEVVVGAGIATAVARLEPLAVIKG
jgi:RNA-splicing ligase RtcB